MNDYVFHCTPCGFAHAGECAPKTITPAGPVIPEVGSKWVLEVFEQATGRWVQPPAGQILIEVVQADPKRPKVRSDVWGAHWGAIEYDISAWTEEGWDQDAPMFKYTRFRCPRRAS